ncbi:MAG: prepilin peptidase [Caldisericia bacterium]|nr:prepilin peptidase [Caldisericia bacterium]MDD4614369.1 prepilin peptidase [Caldisericia bacterium]
MMYQLSYHSIILYVITTVVCGISIVTDIKTRKILNIVTYPAILLGFVVGPTLVLFHGGTFWEGFSHSLWGFLLGFGFFFIFYLVGKGKNMGAGDVKLMGAIGALLGWEMAVNAIILTAIVGLVVAIILFFPLFHALIKTQNASTLKGYGKMTMPYGVSIAIGTVLAILLRILYIIHVLEMPLFL